MNGFGQPPSFSTEQSPSFYGFAGGNFPRNFSIGGRTYSTWEMGQQGPELSPMAKKLGVRVIPAGTQKYGLRLPDGTSSKDIKGPYVEAPTPYKIQRDKAGGVRYVDPKTGQGIGTMSATWMASETSPAEKRRREENRDKGLSWTGRPRSGGGPQPDESATPAIPENALGFSSSTPMAFTRFGSTAENSPNIASPFAGGLGTTGMLTSFSGIPRFPFSGY